MQTCRLFRKIGNCITLQSRGLAKQVVSRGRIEVEGTKLYYERHGTGHLPVLFCPGLVGSVQSNYWPVFKKMDKTKFTLIGIDPEGYGKSRPPERNIFTEEFCLERDARLAGQVMENLGYEKYAVVGWSNGGLTASLLSALLPQNVTRTVLCNAPMWPSDHNNIVMDQLLNLKNWEPSHRKDLLRVYDEESAVKILRDWRFFTRREVEKPHHFAALVQQLICKPRTSFLVIYGTKDTFTTPAEAIASFENVLLPGDRIHFIRNGGHFHLEFLDEFVEVISEYLQEADEDAEPAVSAAATC